MTEAVLDIYVVYADPADYPGRYVVRRQTVGRGVVDIAPEPLGVVDTLEQARHLLPDGLNWLDRQPGDEPQIVEVWL